MLWEGIIADYRPQDKKKAPSPGTGAFESGRPSRGYAAGQLGQPSLQWETGRILNLSIHILWVSFRWVDLLSQQDCFNLKPILEFVNQFFGIRIQRNKTACRIDIHLFLCKITSVDA